MEEYILHDKCEFIATINQGKEKTMNETLKMMLIIAAIVLFGILFFLLRRNSLSIKYSIMWMMMPIMMILMVVFSEPLADFAKLIGFNLLSNFVLVGVCGCLIICCFGLTIMINTRRNQIVSLTQEMAIMKKEIKDLKNEKTK